jgi:cytochrome b
VTIASTSSPGIGGPETVRAWDLPTRVFHWSLVLLMLCSWATFQYSEVIGDHRLVWHKRSGYAVLILVVWRLIWGFVGSSTSRFSGFIRGPGAALAYARDLVAGRSRHFLGHNPLGALMVLVLLALVGAQAAMGLFTVEHNDLTAGPLYRLVDEETQKLLSRWHRRAVYWFLIPAIVLHVTANVLYGLAKKDPLIRAMITGRKHAAPYEDAAEADVVRRPLIRAVGVLILAAALVLGGILALGGRL